MMDTIEFSPELYSRALVSPGRADALLRFRRKLAEGRPVVYGAIGGSITAGARATSPGNSYVSRIAREIQNRTACRLVNAGIGATGSRFGAMRCTKDLLVHRPDLITIEYAVNDITNPDREYSYEALVRRCLEAAPDALIVLIFMLCDDGTSAQTCQIPVGMNYSLAMLSYRNAVWPEVESGRLPWSAIAPDHVHPNDAGHRLVADLVTHFLLRQPAEAPQLPPPVDPRCAEYEAGRVIRAEEMEITANSGWTIADSEQGYRKWTASEPGAELVFPFNGPTLLLGYRKYAGDFGRVSVTVDGGEPIILEGFYEMPPDGDWRGGHIVLEKLVHNVPGRHVAVVRLLSDRHPGSGGHRFDIDYLLGD